MALKEQLPGDVTDMETREVSFLSCSSYQVLPYYFYFSFIQGRVEQYIGEDIKRSIEVTLKTAKGDHCEILPHPYAYSGSHPSKLRVQQVWGIAFASSLCCLEQQVLYSLI